MKKWYPLISAGWAQSGVYQDFGIHGFREMRARLGTGVVPEEKGTKWERIDWRLFPSKESSPDLCVKSFRCNAVYCRGMPCIPWLPVCSL